MRGYRTMLFAVLLLLPSIMGGCFLIQRWDYYFGVFSKGYTYEHSGFGIEASIPDDWEIEDERKTRQEIAGYTEQDFLAGKHIIFIIYDQNNSIHPANVQCAIKTIEHIEGQSTERYVANTVMGAAPGASKIYRKSIGGISFSGVDHVDAYSDGTAFTRKMYVGKTKEYVYTIHTMHHTEEEWEIINRILKSVKIEH